MIIGLVLHIIFIVFLAWRAMKRNKYRNWLFVFAGLVVFALCVEVYRELQRESGIPLTVTPIREMWYRFVYFSLGLYYNEVLHYVRQNKRHYV